MNLTLIDYGPVFAGWTGNDRQVPSFEIGRAPCSWKQVHQDGLWDEVYNDVRCVTHMPWVLVTIPLTRQDDMNG